MNKKQTSSSVASEAAKALQDPNSSEIKKTLAASALSQVNKSHQTGTEIESLASKVLQSPKYSEETKSFAASVLSQSNKERK